MKYLLLSITALLIFTGCSEKKFFEPQDVNDELKTNKSEISSSIKSFNRSGATLEDGKFITKNGLSKISLPENFDFLNVSSDGKVLATNYKNKVLIGEKQIDVSGPVIAASLKNNKLALIYSDNRLELINIKTNKTLFKEYLAISLANDTRITNPFFMGNLILYPTLNGRIVIMSALSNQIIKNISVDPDSEFNNIIFLDIIEESQTLIAATSSRIVSISSQDILRKKYEIRDVITNDNNVYIATIDGQIIKLSDSLEEIAKKKFKYSKIYTLAYSDSLYALESQGFLINISEDFKSDKVYEFDFNNEEKVIGIDDKIYFESDYITLPK
jgi:hypothetical protein